MTNQKAIYIGFSMGSSMGVIYTSTYPEEAQKYLLGTYYYSSTIYWQHAKTYTYRLLKNIYPPFNVVINYTFVQYFSIYSLFRNSSIIYFMVNLFLVLDR